MQFVCRRIYTKQFVYRRIYTNQFVYRKRQNTIHKIDLSALLMGINAVCVS